ncbi:hypothetical protein ACJZ2D_005563 [Fusarium nematophilum]
MVTKSAEYREKLAQTEGVIAFEMEGAGVWRELPCIIVKGVCNYADSEKTKVWQDFAASMAAGTSKAIREAYVQTEKPITTPASQLPIARQVGSSYTNKVERKKDVHQGNTMTVSPQNYVQEGSKFGGDVRAEENVWQGNSMSFS